ncbi:hypothetical protein NSB25_27585 [Acetatifactor muris]|nr:hypothetical protein [Acetatifactor muris]MCR2050987.1 hypothetical protein [Acetatifactor muris]
MKKRGQLYRRCCSMLLALLLVIGLAITGDAPAEAAGTVKEMANLVILVKMRGETGNTLAVKWETIKNMYSGRKSWTDSNKENSFSDYISVITCGKVKVTNLFPQIDNRMDESQSVQVFELSRTGYDTGDAIVEEVIRGIQKAQPGDPLYVGKQSLDLDRDNVIDNLTIIVEGNVVVNNTESSFKANYGNSSSGSDKINGLSVSNYNALTSSMLFDKSVNIHEFLHSLGLPDLYRLNVSSGTEVATGPVGIWDIMASAGGQTPQYVLGYLRKKMGWLEGGSVAEITAGGTYRLTAVSQPDTAGGVRLYTIQTPLPQGDSQTICLEYRKSMPMGEYDHLVDEGLLMYRVDDSVPDHTNIAGGNYIYVYRPGVSAPDDCTVSTVGAALNGTAGETAYGSTDLSAPVSQNTLHYSDGSNSGIRISNLERSADKNSITFQVEFADYGDSWQALGGTAARDVLSDTQLYSDPAGNLYLSYVNTSGQACVVRWDESAGAWQRLGSTLSACVNSVTALASCGGSLYLAYLDGAGYPVYSVWNGSSWSVPVRIDTISYPNSLQLVVEGNEIYAAYQRPQGGRKQLVIRNLNGTIVTDDRNAIDFCNPTVVKRGDLFYVAYADFGGGNAKIDTYNPATGVWTTVYDYGADGNTLNLLHCTNTKIYGLSGTSGISPHLTIWDGSAWKKVAVPQMSNYFRASLVTAGEIVYLAYLDTSANQAGMLRLAGDSFVSCYEGLNGQADEFQAAAVGDKVYVATRTGNSVIVRRQTVEYVPEPTPPPVEPTPPPVDPTPPPLPSRTVSLTPPAGYANPDVYIDGIRYTATKNGGSYTLQLPDKTGKTAVMYYYNERNIPKGMYVWRLNWQGDICTATPMSELQDLLSYHGFSIRVQGYSGLRFKSGIDTGKRAWLLGSGVDGYRLTEYGTLLISGSYLQKYPFIKGGEKVGGGRSYWTENGVVNDRIFETVDGRYRFASVVTKLPAKQYAAELAFRSYAVLQRDDGDQLIIYGPPVARSIYTVAKQILAAGEFRPGSSGYNYVKSIVDTVEGR